MIQPEAGRSASRSLRRACIDERWYLRHRGRLMARCVQLVGDRQVAEDIVHEAFARAIASGLRRDGKSWGWLHTVARNLCIDHLRQAKRIGRFTEAEDLGSAEALDHVVDLVDSSPERQAVASAIGRLRERERVVLWLRDVEGWEYAEIADLEGITPRQARNRAFRARGRVRQRVAAALARTTGAIAVLRQLRWRGGRTADRVLERVALSALSISVTVGGFLIVLETPSIRSPFERDTGSLIANEFPGGADARSSRVPPIGGTQEPGTRDDHEPVTLRMGTTNRRSRDVIPERSFVSVEVRDHEGNLLVWQETSYECDNDGPDKDTIALASVGC